MIVEIGKYRGFRLELHEVANNYLWVAISKEINLSTKVSENDLKERIDAYIDGGRR